jgi:hypothetical protein
MNIRMSRACGKNVRRKDCEEGVLRITRKENVLLRFQEKNCQRTLKIT